MKGIILAGGRATRLYPITKGVCKQLLPVYDKPMIYYPLSVLMLAGIRDILIISTPQDVGSFKEIFRTGKDLGIRISYVVQKEPKGIAQAFVLAEDFIGNDRVCLILGDNIFYGDKLSGFLKEAVDSTKGSSIFVYYVKDPQRYGVIEFADQDMRFPKKVVEKPQKPKSNWVVTGIYFFNCDVVKIAKKLKPSKRGELEITDVISHYIKRNDCNCITLGRGYAWLDTGTYASLIDASLYIRVIEERMGLKIGCVEEIAYRKGYITRQQLLKLVNEFNTDYADYLKRILKDEK